MLMENNIIKGSKGEFLAQKYLKENKYTILQTNYKCKIGEIDIIARKSNVLVFVEVKARESNRFGMPREAVNYYKQQKIKQVATSYMLSKGLYEKCQIRFDVIDILGDKVAHIENAF